MHTIKLIYRYVEYSLESLMLVLVEKGKIIENKLVINNDNVNNMGNYINNRSVNMKYRFFDI